VTPDNNAALRGTLGALAFAMATLAAAALLWAYDLVRGR
jgi:hypothetical protein